MCGESESAPDAAGPVGGLDRRPFGGLLPDVGFADKGQADLFAAIGRAKAPFRGVIDWPYLNAVVQARSGDLLATEGEDAWRAAGGVYGPDGRPTFGPHSG